MEKNSKKSLKNAGNVATEENPAENSNQELIKNEGSGTILDEMEGPSPSILDDLPSLKLKIDRISGKYLDGTDATGSLGTFPLLEFQSTNDLIERFGGGTYQLLVRDPQGKIVKNSRIRIPYDPIKPQLLAAAAAPVTQGFTMQDMLAAEDRAIDRFTKMMQLATSSTPKPQGEQNTMETALKLLDMIEARAEKRADEMYAPDEATETENMRDTFDLVKGLIREFKGGEPQAVEPNITITDYVQQGIKALNDGYTPEQIAQYLKQNYPPSVTNIKSINLETFKQIARDGGLKVNKKHEEAFGKLQGLL